MGCPLKDYPLKIARLIASCLAFLPVSLLAQSDLPAENSPPLSTRGPAKAGSGPTVKVSVGYVYLSLALPSSNRINLSGVDTAVTADFLHHLGATADFSYSRASDVLGSGHHADVLSYLAGPVFYPSQHAKFTTYFHGLMGASRVTGVVPISGATDLTGYANEISWAFGGGVEYQVSRSVAFRGGGDYLHTAFYASDRTIRGQNNFRAICGIVYTPWQHPERRR